MKTTQGKHFQNDIITIIILSPFFCPTKLAACQLKPRPLPEIRQAYGKRLLILQPRSGIRLLQTTTHKQLIAFHF